MTRLKSKLGYWFIWLGYLGLPGVVRADVNDPNNGILAIFNLNTSDNTEIQIGNIVNQVITIILFIVGVAAIIYLILSGLQYITAGGDDEKATNGRKGVINAIIGIIIVMAAWFILRAAANAGQNLDSISNAL